MLREVGILEHSVGEVDRRCVRGVAQTFCSVGKEWVSPVTPMAGGRVVLMAMAEAVGVEATGPRGPAVFK